MNISICFELFTNHLFVRTFVSEAGHIYVMCILKLVAIAFDK